MSSLWKCRRIPHHCFFTCDKVWNIWLSCYKWLRVSIVLPNSPEAHYWQHKNFLFSKQEQEKWDAIWALTVWCIWCLRNEFIHNGGSFGATTLMDKITFNAWCWLKGKVKGFDVSFNQWSVCPGESISHMMCRSSF